MRFAPRAAGNTSDEWVITADDGNGEHDVTFTGVGVPPTVTTTALPPGMQSAPLRDHPHSQWWHRALSMESDFGRSARRSLAGLNDRHHHGTPVASGVYSFAVKAGRERRVLGLCHALDHRVRFPATLNTATVGMASTPDGNGYWIADAAGEVRTEGDAGFYGSMAGQALNAPIAHIVATPDGHGYWLVASDGGTFAFGDAPFYGSMAGYALNRPIVDIAPTPDGRGYWLVASDGGIFAFGDAVFHGSMGGTPLNAPVVGMAADPSPAATGWWHPTAASSPSMRRSSDRPVPSH